MGTLSPACRGVLGLGAPKESARPGSSPGPVPSSPQPCSVSSLLCSLQAAAPFPGFACKPCPTEENGVASGEPHFPGEESVPWRLVADFLSCRLGQSFVDVHSSASHGQRQSDHSDLRGEALGRVEEGGMLEQTGALGAKAGRRELLGGRPVLFPWKCFSWNPCMSQGTWELPEMIT